MFNRQATVFASRARHSRCAVLLAEPAAARS